MYPLKQDLKLMRGSSDTQGYELFLKDKTRVGVEFNNVVPGRKSLYLQIGLYDDNENYLRDLQVSSFGVVRDSVEINGKAVASVCTFDDVLAMNQKALALIKTLAMPDGKTVGDYIN